MIVTRLRQDQHLVVGGLSLAEALAIDARLQLYDPNALASRAAILLHHTGLERDRLPEACRDLRWMVIPEGVLQADVHVLDHAQRLLRAHLRHYIWRGPHRPSLSQLHHRIIELLLAAASRIDLPWVATHHNGIELLENRKELVVLLDAIVHQLATHACINEAIRNRNGIVTMAVADLVAAASFLRWHINLNQSRLELRLLRLREQAVIVLRYHWDGGHIDGARLCLGILWLNHP
mmetsp:Transcript_54008/g.150844  ORF Transcript_54008/g.150844 Transcript_54008/m.150844 type:complete len:235 (-) Transcript_54008:115-819(-)